MNYKEQLDRFEEYFKSSEKSVSQQALGVEIEHFVVDNKTLETVSYSDEAGLADILEGLVSLGWHGKREGEYLVQANKEQAVITLEPGGQLEVSIAPHQMIAPLKAEYCKFLLDLLPLLEENDQALVTAGYQIESKISEIEWNPKQRYQIMSSYLGSQGKYAHNMMKGTASIQVAVDYINEEDFIKKFRIANTLSPLVAALFDNAAIFEGAEYNQYTVRTEIWSNCDPDRSGLIKEAFADDFGYRKYAEYILNRPPILFKDGEEFIATGDQTCRELLADRNLNQAELEHLLTMFFPDVRAKNFIEIRMMDSLPPELTLGVIAFWKGLLYDEDNLDRTYDLITDITYQEALAARDDVVERGLAAQLGSHNILELGQQLLQWAEAALPKEEEEYLLAIKELVMADKTPLLKSREYLAEANDKRKALEWLIMDSTAEVEDLC
ncbi:MAG: glutamate--cysteine ligase [Bacillota bacterium]